jgi:lipopolysaccharide/colanic/teichoic acid biosynthesis glycosyltransferase
MNIVGTPTLEKAAWPDPNRWNWSLGKRVFDVSVASLMFLLSLPVMPLIALLVAGSSEGPVLFRQKRMGRDGRTFELLKFRTMKKTSNCRGAVLTSSNDPRVTRVGWILRRCKLDELPQLINVLRGDMSLVGPRPDLPEFCQKLEPKYRSILRLMPGLTGWASLRFRHEEELLAAVPKDQLTTYYIETILPRKIELDLTYAQRATLLGDAGILWSTFLALTQESCSRILFATRR